MDIEKRQFEGEILDELSAFSLRYGFKQPQIKRDNYSTVIDCCMRAFAVEIQMDWREYWVFILIVSLENGQLPNGYYVSQGKRCREHLRTVLQRCQIPLSPIGQRTCTRDRWRNFAWMKEDFVRDKELLVEHLDSIKKLYEERASSGST